MQTEVVESTVQVGEHEVLVQQFGDGPPLLLIHGFLVSSAEWRTVLPFLGNEFRCIALDLPGFGRSDRPAPDRFDYSLSGYARLIAQLLEQLDAVPCHVAGHSMGGAIAMQFAIDYPLMVQRLVIMDAAWHPFSLSLKARLPFMGKLGEFTFKKLYGRALFRDYFENDVYNGKKVDPEQVDAYYDALDTPQSRDAAYEVLKNMIHPEKLRGLAAQVSKINHPTLVLWGEDDRLIPVSLADKLVRELSDAKLVLLRGCGHAGNEEQPDATARAFREHFAAENARAAPATAS